MEKPIKNADSNVIISVCMKYEAAAGLHEGLKYAISKYKNFVDDA